jgi:hypothetical protein
MTNPAMIIEAEPAITPLILEARVMGLEQLVVELLIKNQRLRDTLQRLVSN